MRDKITAARNTGIFRELVEALDRANLTMHDQMDSHLMVMLMHLGHMTYEEHHNDSIFAYSVVNLDPVVLGCYFKLGLRIGYTLRNGFYELRVEDQNSQRAYRRAFQYPKVIVMPMLSTTLH
jgi:hypothetical protein